MLAYRAEDISERLEPQELYDRQQLEESIQFDVSTTYKCTILIDWRFSLFDYRLLKSAF